MRCLTCAQPGGRFSAVAPQAFCTDHAWRGGGCSGPLPGPCRLSLRRSYALPPLSEPGAGRRKEGVTEGVVLGPPSAVGLGRRKARYGGPQGNARAWEPRVSGVAGFAASGRVDRPALQRRPGSPDGNQCPRVSGVAACLASGRVDRPALRRRPGSPHGNQCPRVSGVAGLQRPAGSTGQRCGDARALRMRTAAEELDLSAELRPPPPAPAPENKGVSNGSGFCIWKATSEVIVIAKLFSLQEH